MKFNYFVSALIIICLHSTVPGQDISIFEIFLPQFRMIKSAMLSAFQQSQHDPNLRKLRELNILQPQITPEILFPCSIKHGRSKVKPTNVNKLRPGDIDVIAAIGDSLIAGNGLIATNILEVFIEHRGMSYAIGGEKTWKQHVTLPNILKEFNPDLIGYSLTTSFTHQNISNFNLAEVGAMSRDTPYMTRKLINRIKADPRVDIQNHWKMISIMIGCNDFCSDICYHSNLEVLLQSHKQDLINVLRILRDNLPKTIVNVLVVPHLKEFSSTSNINRPPMCYFTRNIFCPCLAGLQFRNKIDIFNDFITKWQQVEYEVGNEQEFDREDFAVVVQPFASNYKLPLLKNGLTDYSSLSVDCFHLSQKENARAATGLWNNLLEPVGRKSVNPSKLFNFKCPTKRNAFIYTKRNS